MSAITGLSASLWISCRNPGYRRRVTPLRALEALGGRRRDDGILPTVKDERGNWHRRQPACGVANGGLRGERLCTEMDGAAVFDQRILPIPESLLGSGGELLATDPVGDSHARHDPIEDPGETVLPAGHVVLETGS